MVEEDPCNPNPCGPYSNPPRNAGDRCDCSCQPGMIGQPPNCRPECQLNSDCPVDKICASSQKRISYSICIGNLIEYIYVIIRIWWAQKGHFFEEGRVRFTVVYALWKIHTKRQFKRLWTSRCKNTFSTRCPNPGLMTNTS